MKFDAVVASHAGVSWFVLSLSFFPFLFFSFVSFLGSVQLLQSRTSVPLCFRPHSPREPPDSLPARWCCRFLLLLPPPLWSGPPSALSPLLLWDGLLCSHCLGHPSPSDFFHQTFLISLPSPQLAWNIYLFWSKARPWHFLLSTSLRPLYHCWAWTVSSDRQAGLGGTPSTYYGVSDTVILCLRGSVEWASACWITSVLNLYHFPKSCLHTLTFHLMELRTSRRFPLSRSTVSPSGSLTLQLSPHPPTVFVQSSHRQAEIIGNAQKFSSSKVCSKIWVKFFFLNSKRSQIFGCLLALKKKLMLLHIWMNIK